MNSLKTSLAFFSAIYAIVMLIGCGTKSPDLTGTPRPPTPPPAAVPQKPAPKDAEYYADFSKPAESVVVQNKYKKNEVSVNFRVETTDGQSVDELKAPDFRIEENGVQLSKYEVTADEKKWFDVVDIVLVVDVTGSMTDFIDIAKDRLDEFIQKTYPKYHVRLCLSTFGDLVVQKCEHFYDNKSPLQVTQFRKRLAELKTVALQAEIPTERDAEENPMRALQEVVKAPWEKDSKRFVILVTDEDFYSPEKNTSVYFNNHQARASTKAPSLVEVNQWLKESGIKVFTVTPPKTGYNSPLNGIPDVTTASDGLWFEFKKVVDKVTPLDDILTKILQRSSTTYHLRYIVDDNQGLKVSRKNDERQVVITTPRGKVTADRPVSSQPEGRPEYLQDWNLSPDPIRADSVQAVKMPVSEEDWSHAKPVEPSEYVIQGGKVHMQKVPESGYKIRFQYYYEALEKNLNFVPPVFPYRVNDRNTSIWLNDTKVVTKGDIIFEDVPDGGTRLKLGPNVLAANDPYGVRQRKSLTMKVKYQP